MCGWQVNLSDPSLTRAVTERLRDKQLIVKRYTNKAYFYTLILFYFFTPLFLCPACHAWCYPNIQMCMLLLLKVTTTLITVIPNEVYSFNRAVEIIIICCHNSTHPSIYPSIRLFVSYTAVNVLHYVLHLIHCHAYISCYS